jgi:hypothetical protein
MEGYGRGIEREIRGVFWGVMADIKKLKAK